MLTRENQETKPPPAGWHGSSMAVAYKGEPGNQTTASSLAWMVMVMVMMVMVMMVMVVMVVIVILGSQESIPEGRRANLINNINTRLITGKAARKASVSRLLVSYLNWGVWLCQ